MPDDKATWIRGLPEPLPECGTRTMKISFGGNFIQQINVTFVELGDGPYEYYRTAPYFDALSEEIQQIVRGKVNLGTMGLAKFVSEEQSDEVPVANE